VKAVVVYESMWGSTAAIARAVAEGIGDSTPALSTAEATADALVGIDLIVAGAPVIAFNLTSEVTRPKPGSLPPNAPAPDLSHPMMRSWLEALPAGSGTYAAFETKIRGPFGHTVKTIGQLMEKAGYRCAADPLSAIVTGRYGGIKDGEIERARAWGASLASRPPPPTPARRRGSR
jgi:hypothetical protein